MDDIKPNPTRRQALGEAARLLAGAAAVMLVRAPASAADKKKGKASKEDFYFQETPGEGGKRCENCVNFEPTTGDKGTCSLVEGEVCKTCYCQGWTDKRTGKKAGT